ncbi:Sel1 repeat family protein OS=Lysinibacillus sphaericus OX=1421 GN=LS41612_02905 PE=4 SV=1 [Lysinibacillus sphaericus]
MYGQFLAKQNKERTESLQQSTNIQNTWFAQNLTLLILDEVQLTTLQKMLYQVIQGLLKKKHQRHLQIVHPEQTQTVQDNVLTLLAEYDDVLREAIPLPIYILIWQITSLEKLAYTTEVVDDVLDVLEWYFTHQDETVAVFEEEDLDHEEIIDLYKAAIE